MFDKRVKKSDLLAENFQVWHFKSHENLPGHYDIRFLGTFFAQALGFLGKLFPA